MINLLLPFLVTAVFFLSLVFSFLLNKCRPYLFVVLLYLIVDVKNSSPAQTEYTPYEICGCQQLYPMTILYVLASIRFILLYEVMCNFETDARTILIPQSFMVDCGLHIISVFFYMVGLPARSKQTKLSLVVCGNAAAEVASLSSSCCWWCQYWATPVSGFDGGASPLLCVYNCNNYYSFMGFGQQRFSKATTSTTTNRNTAKHTGNVGLWV